jgi:hypothetical protein
MKPAAAGGRSGPFKADIRLNFRTYPKWVNDAVRAAEPSLPEPP